MKRGTPEWHLHRAHYAASQAYRISRLDPEGASAHMISAREAIEAATRKASRRRQTRRAA